MKGVDDFGQLTKHRKYQMNVLKRICNLICSSSSDKDLLDIKLKVDENMATLTDVRKAIAVTIENVKKQKEEVAIVIADLKSQIEYLRTKLESGTFVSTEDLDNVLNDINDIDSNVKTIIEEPIQVKPVVKEQPVQLDPFNDMNHE